MANAMDVAHFILQLGKANDEEGGFDLISNLKLQKLVYYCQGFSLVILNRPLFEETIEAWEHGPVCPTLYQVFKCYGSDPINVDGDYPASNNLTKDEQQLIVDVYGAYGQFSAWRLREMTHQESPWKNTVQSTVIEHAVMRNYFKKLVSNS